MALATRNLYLVLKARDEASRVIRGFGRELTRAGRLAQAESLRNRAGLAAERAAYLAASGASQHDIDQQNLLARTLRRQAQELERAHRNAIRFSNALHTVGATLVTVGSGMAIGGAVGLAFLVSSVGVAKEYARQVSLTATQVDNFKASLEEIGAVGLRVAKTIAIPFEDIQPALYDILSSTNANLQQAEILLAGFAKTAVAGQVSIQDAARGTIPILNAFNIPLEQVNRILDIQFQLVRKGVGTYADFSAVFGRVVPSATRAGQSFETVAAMLAYLTRNGLSAAMASSSAARALDAMSNPTATKNMEALGIKVRDVAGNFLPLEESLKNLQKYLMALPNSKRIAALVDIFKGAGGTIQARRFLDQILLKPGELNEYIGFLGDMQNANGTFEAAYSQMSNTVAAQTTLMRNKWKVLQEAVGRAVTPAFVVLLTWVNKILDAFNNLSPATQRIIAIGILLASMFGVIAGGILVVVGLLASVVAAVVAAGASFFYLLGGVIALIGGLSTLAVAFGVAWNKSSSFRNLIGQMQDALRKFWQETVIPTAIGIKQAWDQYIAPALSKLAAVLENDVIPAVAKVHSTFTNDLLPALKEIGNFLKGTFGEVFKFIGRVITTLVVPAIQYLSKLYADHKQTIDQLIGVLVWLSKWFLKIAIVVGVILLAAFVGPIIAAVVAFIAVIAATIAIIVAIIEGIKALVRWVGTEVPKAWNWLVEKTKKVWNAIAGFFVGLWDGIVGFFVGAWDKIVAKFNTVMAFLTGLWNYFWTTSIGGLVKAVFGLIVAIIELAIAAIQLVILVGLKIIVDAWNFTWNSVKNGALIVWGWIFPFLKDTWEKVLAGAKIIWGLISTFFMAHFNNTKALVIGVWNTIKDIVTGTWNGIKGGAIFIWNQIYDAVAGPTIRAKDKVVSVWNEVKAFFSDTGSWLFNAGKNLIQGLIDGITSMINKVTEKVEEITKKIKDFFPHSPAKVGPLSGRGGMFYAGQNIVKQLNSGMASQQAMLSASLASTAASAGSSSSSMLQSPMMQRGDVTQIFHINTQEINPRRHSAELGFLLEGRS
jgi:TP901 family phage tail tape measure protein